MQQRLLMLVFLTISNMALAEENTGRILIVGSEQDYPPFAVGQTEETAGGFTVELWKAVAKETDQSYHLRVRPFRQILQAFKDGEIDVLINLAQSAERRQFAEFTVPHVTVNGAIFVRDGETRIHSEADLVDKSIIVLNSDLGHDYAISKGWQKQLVLVDTTAEGFKLLASGQYDAMLISKLAGLQTLQALKLTNIRAIAKAGFSQKFSFAVRKGQSTLLAELNEGLALTKASGVYDALYEKWFGVYEEKSISLQDALRYLIPIPLPIALVLLSLTGLLLHKRHKERRQADILLHASEDQLRTIFETSPEAITLMTGEGTLLAINTAGLKMIEADDEKNVLNQNFHNLVATGYKDAFRQLTEYICQGQKGRLELEIIGLQGTRRWIETHAVPFSNSANGELVQLAISRDISERKRLEMEREKYFRFFQLSIDPMCIVDPSGCFLQVNPAFSSLTGYNEGELVTKRLTDFILPEDRQKTAEEMKRKLTVGPSLFFENRYICKDSKVILLSWTAYYDRTEGVTYAIARDITARKIADEEIKQLAFYDPLTQLANRRLLYERLKHGIEMARRDGKQMALLVLDLDRFKTVNDRLGHLAGDELLQQVAARITAMLRDVDLVARMGGDEFTILLEDIAHIDDAARIAKEIIIDLGKPFKLTHSDDVRIGVSIGITLYPQHGDSPELLMDHADAALYQAKDQGRNCYAYFSEDITRTVRERIAQEIKLSNAIARQELRVFYQPQIDMISGRIIGAEALVHWQEPIEGLIPPILFIPIAEETHLILEIGEWVLRETCHQGRQWLDRGLPSINLSVNVSPYQFRRSNINILVAKVLTETGFPAEQLELEITESGLMENQDKVTAILNNLRTQGIRLALDDFGTGYSSLAYLKQFPLDVLKIDKSFIDEIPHNKDDMEIAATIVAMGHTLGFKVMAEGVETPEQLAFLREHGCDSYQGFIKSRPIPAEQFAEILCAQQQGEL